MELSNVRALAVEELKDLLTLQAVGCPIAESGRDYRDISRYFQAVAICHLMVDGNLDSYRENLIRSGQARLHFLTTCQAEEHSDCRFLAVSRSEAILDVLVAGDLQLAHAIVANTTADFNQNWEYEDDHWYFAFIHQVIEEHRLRTALDFEAILLNFQQSLEEQPSLRLEVCRSIASNDGNAVSEAIEELVEEIVDQHNEKRASITPPEFLFWPTSFISIEVLALLRCAELRGLTIDLPYLELCPQEAFLPLSNAQYPDIFAEMKSLG